MLVNVKTRSTYWAAHRSKTIYLISKRVTDIIVSCTVLLLCLPLYLLICFLVRRQEGNPILHREKCVGLAGETYLRHTFRTMTNRSQVIRALPPHPYPKSWESGVPDQFTFRYTPMTTYTSIGLWLKKYHLDRLPLFYHVLIGKMSLVGPAPELCEIASYYNEYQKQRLSVRPGLTGYAQVKGGFSEQFYNKVQADLYYIQHRSYSFDLKIIIRAVSYIFLNNEKEENW